MGFIGFIGLKGFRVTGCGVIGFIGVRFIGFIGFHPKQSNVPPPLSIGVDSQNDTSIEPNRVICIFEPRSAHRCKS